MRAETKVVHEKKFLQSFLSFLKWMPRVSSTASAEKYHICIAVVGCKFVLDEKLIKNKLFTTFGDFAVVAGKDRLYN